MALVLDALLVLLLVVLATHLMREPDLFEAGVWFIAFGLVMALAWLRLGAPDVALAEAAIGAGVTGALFLNTLAEVREHPADCGPLGSGCSVRSVRSPAVGLLALALTGLVAGVVGALVPVATGRPAPDFPEAAAGNPVTAVLLDVRGYDTLLETAVLLLALAGVAAAGRGPQGGDAGGETAAQPLLMGLVRLLVPAGVLIAGALVWLGGKGAGGAFQAGAVLGGSGILLQLTGIRAVPPQRRYAWVRLLAVAGTGVFLGVALGTLAAGRGFLDYPAAGGASLVLLIEVGAAVSVGLLLLGLFEGVGPFRRSGRAR